MVDTLLGAVSSATRVVAVTWVHSSSGVKLPVRRIADGLSEINSSRGEDDRILLCVDGVHGIGVENVTMPALGCDFFVAGCHKWLFGPRGTGFVWGDPTAWPHAGPTIPSFGGGSNGAANTPGGFHSFEHRWALSEAFRFHQSIGKAQVEARIHSLARQLKKGLAGIGHVTLKTPLSDALSAGIICFTVDGMSPSAVIAALRRRRVIATVTPYSPSYARLAPGIVNTPDGGRARARCGSLAPEIRPNQVSTPVVLADLSERSDTVVFVPAWNEEANLPGGARRAPPRASRGRHSRRGRWFDRWHGRQSPGSTVPRSSRSLRTVGCGLRSRPVTGTPPSAGMTTAAGSTPTGSTRVGAAQPAGARPRGECDVAVGSRFVTGEDNGFSRERYESSPARRLGTGLLRRSMEVVLDRPFHDATSGMYAANARAIPILARPYTSGAPEVEAVFRLDEEGLDVREVPVQMRERATGESKLRGSKALVLVLTVVGTLFSAEYMRRRRGL